jgi:probable rRNA maturation factor
MEPPSPYRILILNDSGCKLRQEALRRTVRLALEALDFPGGELSLRLTTDAAVRDLNRGFRSLDEVTDVLTFPAEEGFPTGGARPLGDVAIAAGQAARQAQARGIPFEAEVAYLALHGVLHISGLDDETDAQRERMLAEMSRLGTLAGLPQVHDWHTMAPVGSQGMAP